uniref:Uncharacterized protein n=1 Tax=Triticum urartu TaxID=4572 RepID=A0A8R7U2F1_TRIUA
MTLNSSKEMRPSPFLSTPSIMRRHCCTVAFSPRPWSTRASSAAEMSPLPSASNTLKASRRSSSSSPGAVALSAANSSRLMKPSPSASASAIMRVSSSSVAAWPRLSKRAASSGREIRPSPLASNLRKTRSISSSGDRAGDPMACRLSSCCSSRGGVVGGDAERDLEEERRRNRAGIFILPIAVDVYLAALATRKLFLALVRSMACSA